jgi:hypothetical protein
MRLILKTTKKIREHWAIEYAIENKVLLDHRGYDIDADPSGVKSYAKRGHGQAFYQWVMDNDKIIRLDDDYNIVKHYIAILLKKDIINPLDPSAPRISQVPGVTINFPTDPNQEWVIQDEEVPRVSERYTAFEKEKPTKIAEFLSKPSFKYEHQDVFIPVSELTKDKRFVGKAIESYKFDESNPANRVRAVPISFRDLRIPKKKVAEEAMLKE